MCCCHFFLAGAATSYMRFFPYIKKNYDYGVLIFLLTFNLITVSSYRTENLFKMIYQRFYTIAIGCAICLLMSLLVFPNWSGEALHNSTAFKLEGLAKSIEGIQNHNIHKASIFYKLFISFYYNLKIHEQITAILLEILCNYT